MILMRTLDFIEANAAVWSFVMSYMAIVWIPSPGAGSQYACCLPACLTARCLSVCLSGRDAWSLPGCGFSFALTIIIIVNCSRQLSSHGTARYNATRHEICYAFFIFNFKWNFHVASIKIQSPIPARIPLPACVSLPPLSSPLFPCGVNFALALSKFVFHFWPRQNLLHTFDASPQGAGYS